MAGNVRLSRHGEYANGFRIPFTFHVVILIPGRLIIIGRMAWDYRQGLLAQLWFGLDSRLRL
jgi:hypothetical protein